MIARKYGSHEIELRHRVNRLSLLVSAARGNVRPGTLPDTVIRTTYPSILSAIAKLDDRRAESNRNWGQITEHYFSSNEYDAELLCLHAHVCIEVLRNEAALLKDGE